MTLPVSLTLVNRLCQDPSSRVRFSRGERVGGWVMGGGDGPGARRTIFPPVTQLRDVLKHKKQMPEPWFICTAAQCFGGGHACRLSPTVATCPAQSPGSSWAERLREPSRTHHAHLRASGAAGVLLRHLSCKGLKASVPLQWGPWNPGWGFPPLSAQPAFCLCYRDNHMEPCSTRTEVDS